MQFQKEERMGGDGAIMSPFAGPGETSGLNPELRARDSGVEGARMPRVVGQCEAVSSRFSCRRAFAHGEDDAEVESVRAGDGAIIALQL